MSRKTTIREQPILFSAPMVRAILSGSKTQTRRVVHPRHVVQIEVDEHGRFAFMHAPDCGGFCDYGCAAAGETLDGHIGWTPHGSHPREWGNLWGRETAWYDDELGGRCFYRVLTYLTPQAADKE